MDLQIKNKQKHKGRIPWNKGSKFGKQQLEIKIIK